MFSPSGGAAQDGTKKWLRHPRVTNAAAVNGSALVTQHSAAPNQGFQASHDHANCKAALALRLIQGRWKVQILRELLDGERRFSDLQRSLRSVHNGVSQKVLTAQLRELEADGVVARTVHPDVPPRVEYALSGLGRELIPVLEGLHAFGERLGGGDHDHTPASGP